MRRLVALPACLILVLGTLSTAARAVEFKSGPQVGELVDAYNVVKAAGAADDGVAVGESLCYRCKMGNRPMVMVFARTTDAGLANLVKQLDKLVAENKDKKMGSFVSLLGDKPEDLKSEAKSFVNENKIENVAFVVPEENKDGPSAYKIDPKADVTVLIYRQGKVAANYALPAGALDEEEIKKIVADTGKILD